MNGQTRALIKAHATTLAAADEHCQKIMTENDTGCLRIRMVPFGLRTWPAEFLDKHRRDRVAPPGGKDGALDTTSESGMVLWRTRSAQRAELPNEEGGFTMDMGQDQIGSQPLETSESVMPGCCLAATGDSAACWQVQTWV